MEDLLVDKDLIEIKSFKGIYKVIFTNDIKTKLKKMSDQFFIIDRKVYNLYSNLFDEIYEQQIVLVDAAEENKAFEKLEPVISELLEKGLKRNHQLWAIGGGIIQDITCFISSVVYRGVDWGLIPTTLLAQADSCIGSKSSINFLNYKNLLGNFNPPMEILLDVQFLKTLSIDEVKSGIGEIIKVHIIGGLDEFKSLAKAMVNVEQGLYDLEPLIKNSLLLKKKIIEIDEFDKKERLVMNYGHTFGHAIESATHYKIPHGIAITIGMDFANYVSMERGEISKDSYEEYNQTIKSNWLNYNHESIPFNEFWSAIFKDKKNIDGKLTLILPKKLGGVERLQVEKTIELENLFKFYLAEVLPR